MLDHMKTLAVVVAQAVVAPFLVLFHRPDPRWSYVEALLQRLLNLVTPTDVGFLRLTYAIYGRFQRHLFFPPLETVDVPAVKGMWYGDASTPPADCAVVVLFVHGGGFVCGTADAMSFDAIRPLLASLRRQGVSAVRVFSVSYDLAPQACYPRQIQQTYDAYRWLLDLGVSPTKIVVMGDSAGGNCALSLLQQGLKDHMPMPACAVLVSPWVDLHMTKPSYDAATDSFTKATVFKWRDVYLNGDSTHATVTAASPGLQSLRGLPSLMVTFGKNELMADDLELFVAKAKASHVNVVAYSHPYLFHDFPTLPLGQPSRDGMDAIGRFIISRATTT
ncbi:Aste57867_11951 [Aphanomyces stellatus]|uniref:Aste57867_11951 protein n=1 Tax=Aphanomyces stellatus TaxID=120398 RepID=A0A485KV40_9STRA|nr:hypothetical protein As57867_011906 [Aphanomyces stellatus]VFT88806.1 Aste57867_11951 [Aphanomyces stellatus]